MLRMKINGGGGGIRTHGRVAPTRHFQCRTFGHSATPPAPFRSASTRSWSTLPLHHIDLLHRLHAADRPNRLAHGQHGFAMLRIKWRRGEDLNPRGTCAPIRFRVGRLQPGSATPPRLSSSPLKELAQYRTTL